MWQSFQISDQAESFSSEAIKRQATAGGFS